MRPFLIALQFGRPCKLLVARQLAMCTMERMKLQAWALAAFVLAAQTPAARACERSYYGPLKEAPWFCTEIVAALDFEVVSVQASPGENDEAMYDILDEETGERTPNQRWRPDAYPLPHFDVRIRQLARYGEHWPEQLAIIEENSDGTPPSQPPLLAPGTRWRLYRNRDAQTGRLSEREIVSVPGCGVNVEPLEQTHGPPACAFAQKVERPAARGHGCASCGVGASQATAWRDVIAWAIGLGCLSWRRRCVRSSATGDATRA